MSRTMLGTVITSAALSLMLGACQKPDAAPEQMPAVEAATVAQSDSGVALAASIARAVNGNPQAADSILTAHGTTAPQLDSLMYAIASDSARAAAYAAALR